jgi:hypothetical protein
MDSVSAELLSAGPGRRRLRLEGLELRASSLCQLIAENQAEFRQIESQWPISQASIHLRPGESSANSAGLAREGVLDGGDYSDGFDDLLFFRLARS